MKNATERKKKMICTMMPSVNRSMGPVLMATMLMLAACRTPVQTSGTASVGGNHIAYYETGQGSPSVVFESGLGDGKDTWASVLPEIAKTNRVFAYDRPGYGASQKTDVPRDPCSIATEERELLQASGLPPPYILVGHSAGGLYQYVFAKLFPQDVAGVVLLDPTHPDHWATMQTEAPGAAATLRTLRSILFSSTERSEFDSMVACMNRVNTQVPMQVPARVLVRTQFEGMESGAFATMSHHLAADWGRLAGIDHVEPISGSGHYIQKDKPLAVIDAVASMTVRTR